MKVSFSTNFNSGIASYSNFEFAAYISDTFLDSADLNFSWDFGDGTTGEGVLINHVFSKPGIFKVTVSTTVDSVFYSYYSFVNVEYNFSYNPITNDYIPQKVFKKNEDNNIGRIIQDLAICPIFYESPEFFNTFLTSIFGSLSTNPNEDLGTVLYEKISNFTSNHADIDTCNIKSLFNIADMLDIEKDNLMLNYPPSIKRLVDIGSINVNYLFGDSYKDEFYFPDKVSTFTPNASSQIRSIDTQISANVVLAKRNRLKNKDYETIYTPIINLSSVYYLSDLASYLNWEDSWWNSNFFYFYTQQSSTDQATGVLDWSNPFNTFSLSQENKTEWSADGGFLENMFAYELYKGLNLFNQSLADVQIAANYWYSTSDSDWYNLANWYFDEDLKYPATILPTIGSNLYLKGFIRPLVNISDSRWVSPSSINVGSLGISVSATEPKVFDVDIVGTAVPLIIYSNNVSLSSQEFNVPSLFWYSSSSNVSNWYTLSCWFGDRNRQFRATVLPTSSSNLTVLGAVRPEIDLDDVKWTPPSSIDVGVAGILVKSNYGKSFDVNVTGLSNPLVIFNIRTLYANVTG